MPMSDHALEALWHLASAAAVATRALEAQGLSFAELRLLGAVRDAGEAGARPTDLARTLHLTASGVTRALLPLEKRGIVARQRDPGDARASRTRLTLAGGELLADALSVAQERAGRLFRRLSLGQTKQLQRLLDEIG